MFYTLYNCSDLTAEEIITYIIEFNPELYDITRRAGCYVGATGNIASRLYRHKADRVIFCARVANSRVAAAVERKAAECGFDIGNVTWGGNGTNTRSVYVYAYEKTPHSIP